jgi:hypothetical protein
MGTQAHRLKSSFRTLSMAAHAAQANADFLRMSQARESLQAMDQDPTAS